DFCFRAHVDAGSDAMIQHRLAEVPAVGSLRFPEPWKDELTGRIDDTRVRRNGHLTFSANGGDFGALNDDDGIRDGRTAIAIDERSAFDNESRLLRRLRGHNRHGERNPEQRTGHECFHGCLPEIGFSRRSPEPRAASRRAYVKFAGNSSRPLAALSAASRG